MKRGRARGVIRVREFNTFAYPPPNTLPSVAVTTVLKSPTWVPPRKGKFGLGTDNAERVNIVGRENTFAYRPIVPHSSTISCCHHSAEGTHESQHWRERIRYFGLPAPPTTSSAPPPSDAVTTMTMGPTWAPLVKQGRAVWCDEHRNPVAGFWLAVPCRRSGWTARFDESTRGCRHVGRSHIGLVALRGLQP